MQEGLCLARMEVRVDDDRVGAGSKAGPRPLATWPLNCQLMLRCRGGPSGFIRSQEPTAEAVEPEHLTGCKTATPPGASPSSQPPQFQSEPQSLQQMQSNACKICHSAAPSQPHYLGNTDMREGSLHHALEVGVHSDSGRPTASSLLTSAHWLG